MRNRWLVPAGAAAAVLVIAACGSSGNGGSGGSSGSGNSPAASAPAASSGSALKTMKVGSATVLADSRGLTLYWFVPDTSTKSNCNGSCIHYWPPVTGPVTAGSGVTGHLGTITRSNGLKLSGGVWHAIILTGHAGAAASPTASSGGGGYGY